MHLNKKKVQFTSVSVIGTGVSITPDKSLFRQRMTHQPTTTAGVGLGARSRAIHPLERVGRGSACNGRSGEVLFLPHEDIRPVKDFLPGENTRGLRLRPDKLGTESEKERGFPIKNHAEEPCAQTIRRSRLGRLIPEPRPI